MSNLSVLKHLHTNLTYLSSNNDNKYDIIDANKVPYVAKFNREILDFLSIADENGCIKLFKTHNKLRLIKEIQAQKSCIYDVEWLNSSQLACAGADKIIAIYDVNTGGQIAVLKGPTESIKSLSSIPNNPFVVASGSRDGAILMFDIRCNKTQPLLGVDSQNGSAECLPYIRSMNGIQKAHFIDDPNATPTGGRSALKNKTTNLNSPKINLTAKKPSPVSCVAYQNENTLVSAGATDGLIKVWDTRKMYSCLSKKLNSTDTNQPLCILDNRLNVNCSSTKTLKGYSHLLFNNARTRLFSTCLNNYVFENNLVTFNPSHARVLNARLFPSGPNSQPPASNDANANNHTNTYNTINSNYIKASVSNCDNFLLCGSSDGNAYIFMTEQNQSSQSFKKIMPVIVLKGHLNEVTTVDWNPFDSNQLVTCSDDNTVRLWNVKRDIEFAESKECNFCRAEIVNEFAAPMVADSDEQAYKNANCYASACSGGLTWHEKCDLIPNTHLFNNRNYNRNLHCSYGMYDDFIFKYFDDRASTAPTALQFDRTTFDNDIKLHLADLPVNLKPETSPEMDTSGECEVNRTPDKENKAPVLSAESNSLLSAFRQLGLKSATKEQRKETAVKKTAGKKLAMADISAQEKSMLGLATQTVKKRTYTLMSKQDGEHQMETPESKKRHVTRTVNKKEPKEPLVAKPNSQEKTSSSSQPKTRTILDYFQV